MNIKHILVDIDPTKNKQPALSKAIDLAVKFDAGIELLLVDYNGALASKWMFDEQQFENAKAGYLNHKQRWLRSYVDDVVDQNVPVSVDVVWNKSVFQGIMDKVRHSEVDLVVKSTHRHSTLNKVLFTPNDWRLLKACPVPLLLAKEGSRQDYRNIMAAVDPTQSGGKPEGLDKLLLETTVDLSNTFDAEAHAVHCYEAVDVELWQSIGIGAYALGVDSNDYVSYQKRVKQSHQTQFSELLEGFDFKEENKHLEAGMASFHLPEVVDDHDIDLIVMGTMYRSGPLGSTAEKVLDNLGCDVLAIKPEDFDFDKA